MVQMRIPTISEEYEPSGYGVCTTHLDIQVPCSRKVAGPVIPGVTATPLGKVSPTRGAVSVRLAGRSRRSVNGSKHRDGGLVEFSFIFGGDLAQTLTYDPIHRSKGLI